LAVDELAVYDGTKIQNFKIKQKNTNIKTKVIILYFVFLKLNMSEFRELVQKETVESDEFELLMGGEKKRTMANSK